MQTEVSNGLCEIEKYETMSPFYPTSRSNTPTLPDTQIDEPLTDSQFIYTHEMDITDTLQSPEAFPSESEEESLLEVAKEMQAKSKENKQTKKIRIERNRSETLQTSESTTSESEEEPLLEVAKETQPKSIENKQPKKIQVKRTRTCQTKRKSRSHQESDKLLTMPLNDSNNENASKKVAYRCEPCKKFFYGSITYEGHIKRVHEGIKKAYQCKDCDKAYSFPHNLAEHIASSHRKLNEDESLKVLQCEHCNKPYKSKASLTQHLRNHHQNCSLDSKRIICDQCGFLAAHQMSLAQHIKNKHTEIEEIKCEQCSKVFKSQYYLKYHIMSFHNPMNIKPFKCPQCPMAFTRRPRLNIHIRTHLNYSERIKCDFDGCDVRFVKLSAKRRHMRLVHLKVKQHVCDICGEAFGIKATLRHHRYIHTGEKPYKCNVCGQAFRQLTAMKTHRKMHANKAETVATSTESDILSSLTQIDGGFEDSSNGFV